MATPPPKPATSSVIVILAGLTIIAIAIVQLITDGHPDSYTVGALLALALGGGVGRVADNLVKGYVQAQIAASTQPPAPPPPTLEADDEAPA